MSMQKVEFEFPDPDSVSKEIEIEPASGKTDITEKPQKLERTPAASAIETDLEIEIQDDTPAKDRNRKPSEPPTEVTDEELGEISSEKTRKRLQHFSKGYHDERRKAEAAQRERDEAVRYAQIMQGEVDRLKEESTKNQEALIAQAKARTTAELEQAKRAYKDAYESGDSDKVLAAQEALIAAKNKSERVANWKPPPLQKKETVVQPEPVAATPPTDPKASAWQNANSWFGTDDEMTALALGLHQRLVREGVDPRSDDYYDRINSRMRQLFPERFEAEDALEEEPPPAVKPRRAAVVAPASRSTAPKKIVLTASAVALAKRLGITPEQYARQVAEDMRKQNG